MPQTLPLGNARRGGKTVYEGDQGVDWLTFLKIAIEVAHFRSGTNECLIKCGVGDNDDVTGGLRAAQDCCGNKSILLRHRDI